MAGWRGCRAVGVCILAMVAAGCRGDGGPGDAEDGSLPGADPRLEGPDAVLEWTADTVAPVGGAAAPAWAAFQEVTGLAFDGRGHLHILDGPQRRLVVLDSAGRYQGTVGQAGQGPGEFRAPAHLGVGEDGTVWIYDAGHGALLVFGPGEGEGGPVARFLDQYPLDEHGWIPAGPLLVDGARVVFPARPRGGAGSDASVAREAASAGGPRDVRAVVAFRHPDSLAVLYRGWAPPIPLGRSLTEEETGGFRVRLPPVVGFPPELHVALLPGGRLAVADSTTWTVRVLDAPGASGGGTNVLTRPLSPSPVTGAVREAERARRRAALEADPPRMVVSDRDGGAAAVTNDPVLRLERARIDAMGFHEVIPVIRAMAADPEGRIWVQRHAGSPGQPGPVDLVTADGHSVGSLSPESLPFPAALGPDGLVAAVSRDAFGAPVLHILRLR